MTAEQQSAERQRIENLHAISKRLRGQVPGVEDLCNHAIVNGIPVADVQDRLFSMLPGVTPMSRPLQLSGRDLSNYSLSRAIKNASENGSGKPGGFEQEISDDLARRSGITPQGFVVPFESLYNRADVIVGTATLAGAMKATNLLAGSFIDILRNKALCLSLGATVLDGLTGTVTIPRQTNASTAYWVTETEATTQSNPGWDQLTLAPKCISGLATFSKLALAQTTPSIDMLIRDDLMNVLAVGIDNAMLNTVSGAPTAIAATTGIATVTLGANGAAPSWATVVSLESSLATSNADQGALAYLTNPKVKGALKQVAKSTAAVGAGFVWGEDGTVNGYKAFSTNQVASNLTKGTNTATCSACYFADWSQLAVGMWSGVDLVVDPFSSAANRLVKVYMHQFISWGLRHPESFSVALDILA